MRIVIDANVFVSAAIRTGPSHRLVQAWLEHEAFELIVCPRCSGRSTTCSHGRDCVVTGDKDLLDWPGQRPPAITPAAFERLMDLSGEP